MKTNILLLTIFAVIMSNSLFSQEEGRIIYTDFENDTIRLIDSICIDMNCDNILDYKVVHKWSDTDIDYQTVDTYYNWEIASIFANDTLPIMNHTNWTNSALLTMCWIGEPKDFNFIFRYNINDNDYCYGWIRFSIRYGYLSGVCSYRYIFHDMAYCTIPNYPLRFGQTSFTDVDENSYEPLQAKLFPNPADDKLSLRISGDISCDNVMIYGIDGRLLKIQNDDFENIDVSDLSGGIYITKITLDNGNTYTDKIVIR